MQVMHAPSCDAAIANSPLCSSTFQINTSFSTLNLENSPMRLKGLRAHVAIFLDSGI
jgi:hypothetical protein